MKNYNVSKNSEMSMDEKLEMIDKYNIHDFKNDIRRYQ